MNQTIDTTVILNSYAQTSKDILRVHLLIIPDAESSIQYIIRCNGATCPLKRYVQGYMIPLMLVNEVPIRQASDHINGCSNLNFQINKRLVEAYATRIERLLHRLYIEPRLTLHMDMNNLQELVEGYTPVIAQGQTITGVKLESPTRAIITSGNCV
jgi:hypothetical protein